MSLGSAVLALSLRWQVLGAENNADWLACAYNKASRTAPTTARGVIVAPVNWSNSPPSFLTCHGAKLSFEKDLSLNVVTQLLTASSILSPNPGVSLC